MGPTGTATEIDGADVADRAERRRQQNRRAQRNHRSRMKAYVSSLEQHVVENILQTPASSSMMPAAASSSIQGPVPPIATPPGLFGSLFSSSAPASRAASGPSMFSTLPNQFNVAAATASNSMSPMKWTAPAYTNTVPATMPRAASNATAPATDECCCDCSQFAASMHSQMLAHGQSGGAGAGMFGCMPERHKAGMPCLKVDPSNRSGLGVSVDEPFPLPPDLAPLPPVHHTAARPALASSSSPASFASLEHMLHPEHATAPSARAMHSLSGAMLASNSSLGNPDSYAQSVLAPVPIPGVYLRPDRGVDLTGLDYPETSLYG